MKYYYQSWQLPYKPRIQNYYRQNYRSSYHYHHMLHIISYSLCADRHAILPQGLPAFPPAPPVTPLSPDSGLNSISLWLYRANIVMIQLI